MQKDETPAGSLVLSVDFGTSAIKISILDGDLNTLQSEKEEYPYILLPGEKVEMAPAAVLDALYACCGRMDAALRSRIGLLCYDTYSPSLVIMDEAGDPLYNIVTHMDRRSRKQSEFICEKMGKEKYQSIAGVFPFTGGISLTSLLWFIQEDPALAEKVKRIGHLPTFLHKRFTGIWAVDLCNASMMGLYDTVRQSGWSEEICKTFGVREEWLSPIHIPGEELGSLLPDMAAHMGVPAGIPVTMGTNDVVAAHAGAGNDRSGQILNTAGSSDMVSILTDKPCLHPQYYIRNAGVPGLWQIYATTSGGFAVEWFYREFCQEMDRDSFYKVFLPESLKLRKDNPVAFAPYLAEDRQSLERRTAGWTGLTLAANKKQMLASLLYSMQKVLSDTVEYASAHVKMDPVIKLSGGLAVDEVLELKKEMFPGFRFEFKDDCCILGNLVMAKQRRKG